MSATVLLVAFAIAAMMALRQLISHALQKVRIATHADVADEPLQRRIQGCGRTQSDTPERSNSDAT